MAHIGPPIGVGPKQFDFLFGAYKDQRPIMSQENKNKNCITL